MNAAELIALGSFLAACLAALYARWVWREARKTNDIALHERKLQVYKAFEALRFAMFAKADSIGHADTAGFYSHSRDSEFYFTPEVYEKLRQYFDTCFQLAELNRKKATRKSMGHELADLYKEQDRLLSQEADLSKEIDAELRSDIKIVRR